AGGDPPGRLLRPDANAPAGARVRRGTAPVPRAVRRDRPAAARGLGGGERRGRIPPRAPRHRRGLRARSRSGRRDVSRLAGDLAQPAPGLPHRPRGRGIAVLCALACSLGAVVTARLAQSAPATPTPPSVT